jgi:hypothetical protein
MKTAKANILQALIKQYEDKGKFFQDFRIGLQEDTAEERAVTSLIFAFNAWSGNQWNLNDSLSEIIRNMQKAQQGLRDCKDVSTQSWAQSRVEYYSGRSKEIENGIYHLCQVIDLPHTITKELFKKVVSFIDFDSSI